MDKSRKRMMMNAVDTESIDKALLLTGVVGFLGAVLVGVGEFTLQFNPMGGYEAADYRYFAAISYDRLTVGHFLSVLSAPFYLVGYWHLGQVFARGGSPKIGRFVTLFGGYAFVIGNAWLGGRVYIALLVHKIEEASQPATRELLLGLLQTFSQHNEPLVNVLRAAMLLISIVWIACIAKGKTLYPGWMALFSPIAILAAIFGLYFLLPSHGAWILPAAMNVTHAIVFGLSIIVLRESVSPTIARHLS